MVKKICFFVVSLKSSLLTDKSLKKEAKFIWVLLGFVIMRQIVFCYCDVIMAYTNMFELSM